MSLLGLGLIAAAGKADEDAAGAEGTCGITVVFGTKARVYDVRLRRCREHHPDLERRVRQVPWDLVISNTVRELGFDSTEDWSMVLKVEVPAAAPVHSLPSHPSPSGADRRGVPLSDRFTAPSPDRRVRLKSAVLVPPEDATAMLGSVLLVMGGADPTGVIANSSRTPVSVHDQGRAERQEGKEPGSAVGHRCRPWLVFDEAGRPIDLATHPPGACPTLPSAYLEPLMWRWSPPRWDGQPIRVGVPLDHTGVGEFSVGSGERFAPFYAGDTLVSDVPHPLKVAKGGRPQLATTPEIEIPMVFPELLESRLGLEDASHIRCEVHLWAAPGRPRPYALTVQGCPDFFGSVVTRAYEAVFVAAPGKPTEHVETVLFTFDPHAEIWRISRS